MARTGGLKHRLCVAIMMIAFGSPVRGEIPSVTIDPNVSWGKWDAWGVSLAWWAKVFGERKEFADLLFTTGTGTYKGQPLPALGMNYVRYNLGACSWNRIGN